MKQAILFLSDKSSQWIIDKYKAIATVHNNITDVYFLFHKKGISVPNLIENLNCYSFTSNILHELGYTPLEESLIPGSNHFPLLKFFLENNQYDYYWIIEDDVCFTGKWIYLFDSYKDNHADFISSHIKKQVEKPQWCWWSSLSTGQEQISPINYICSFNPIYRLSNKALICINEALKKGWSGHHEVVIPTLLYSRGFKLSDMGGFGSFVEKGYENRFYTEQTMSHLPIVIGDISNCIYHPIKEKKNIKLDNLKGNCIISAVGKDSLHQKWIKGNPNFDLHLIVYDNSYSKYCNDTDFITYQKGNKFRLIFDYLEKNPEYLNLYEYFFFPDDDIQIDSLNISKLFQIMEEFNLQIAQPALSNSYYTYEHTLKDKSCQLRYTNFVEMMVPCFSRTTLKKVLPTFKAGKSGWGIEYHWPFLINFKGKEIAIIDQLYAIHTRPLQSNNPQKRKELVDYMKNHNLNWKIVETGFILNSNIEKEHNFLSKDRKTYKLLTHLCNLIADNLLQRSFSEYFPIGFCGTTGISLVLIIYSHISEKKHYADIALSIIENLNGKLARIKDNIDFHSGLPGFSWYIEYLAQHEFIDNTTDETLEKICNHINNQFLYFKPKLISKTNQLHGIILHYISRISNSQFGSNNSDLHKNEKESLKNIIQIIKKWSESFTNQSKHTSVKSIIDYILLMSQIKDVTKNPEIDSIIQKLIKQLELHEPYSLSTYLIKRYTLILACNKRKKKQLVKNTIIDYDKYVQEKDSQEIIVLYLLYELYIHSNHLFFKQEALRFLRNLIDKHKDGLSLFISIMNSLKNNNKFVELNNIITFELILLSILSNENLELNNCILLNTTLLL